MSEDSKRKCLLRLIRRIAREEIYVVLDEHLDNYWHKEKPAEDFEAEIGAENPDGE